MPPRRHRDPALFQVLSLYLLLLAFFAILHNISRTEDARSRALAGSLNSTFSHEGASGEVDTPLIAADGNVILRSELERIFGSLVRTAIPIAEIEVVRSRGLLQVRLPIDEIFSYESDSILARQRPLLVEIATILADPPIETRYDVEVLIGAAPRDPEAVGVRPGLAVARAGRLGEALVASGAPRGTVAAGIATGDDVTMRLLFHVRPQAEAHLRLDPVIDEVRP